MSRHNHFPRFDMPRRAATHAASVCKDAEWGEQDGAAGGIVAAMRTVDDASPADVFARLAPWFDNDRWVTQRLADAANFLRIDDFAAPPMRPFMGGSIGGLILAESGSITLSLMVRPGESAQQSRSGGALFSPGHGLTRFVRSGGAAMDRYAVTLTDAEQRGEFTAAGAQPCRALGRTPITDGLSVAADQQCETFNLVGGTGDIVMLQLFIQRPTRVPMREYDAATGTLIRVASANRASSFRQMSFALLRTLGRRDAVPLFETGIADDDFSLRWQTMRELVALDARTAMPHLAAMAASDPHPEIRRAATATLDIVQSRISEATPCP